MFKKKDDYFGHIDSILDESLHINGDMEAKTNIRIDGNVEGNVTSEGDVTISDTGRVKGHIRANQVLIAGKVSGNVEGKLKVEVLSSGQLFGDVLTSSFVIQEKARFEGKCTMNNKENSIQSE